MHSESDTHMGVKRTYDSCYDNGVRNRQIAISKMQVITEAGVMEMARFYDTVSDSDLSRVERILNHGGIQYSWKILGDGSLLKEIQVAEEDLAEAERILSQPSADE